MGTKLALPLELGTILKTIVRDAYGVAVIAANSKTRTHEENLEIAELIVRAVNSHDELLSDAKANAEWFSSNGYPTEAANIRRLIAKAEKKGS